MEVVHGPGARPARHHPRARQRGRGVPRLQGGTGQQHRDRALGRARARGGGRCAGARVRRAVRAGASSSRSPCSGSCSRPTPPNRCTSAAATTRPRSSGSSRRRRSSSRSCAGSSADGGPYRPLAIALAATVAVHVLDLLAGARLELNTVFGYSATVGIRVAGQGNITFSQLTAAVLLLGGLAVWRRPGRRTVYAVIAMLAVTLLVMAAPPFGGDFGAAIAGAPGFGLFAWLLLGRAIRLRTVVILGGVLVVAGLLVGLRRLPAPARPADPHRTLLRRARERRARRLVPHHPAQDRRQPRLVRRDQAAVGAPDRRPARLVPVARARRRDPPAVSLGAR